MKRAAIRSLIAGFAAALGMGFGTGADAQTCAIPVTGNVDLTATVDAAAGRLTIDAPDTFGDSLTVPAPIVLDATVGSNGVFSVPGEFVLAADGVNLTWRVTSGTLTVDEADQAGTLELAAELTGSSDGAQRSGTFELDADVSVVELVQPTPLLITGTVYGNVACGGTSPQGGSVTTVPAAGAGTGNGDPGGAGQGVTAQDDNLAMTGVSPFLVLVGALVAFGGAGAVLYGLGRVRIARWFPKTMPGELHAGR